MTDAVQIDPVAQHFFVWLQAQYLVTYLLVMMFLDILSGFFAAVITKTVCSTLSWQGMCKKAMVWLIVGAAAMIGRLAPDVPLVNLTCTGFLYVEAISIMENAGRAGVPLPQAMLDVLRKVRKASVVPDLAPQYNIREVSLLNVQAAPAPLGVDPIAGPRGEPAEATTPSERG